MKSKQLKQQKSAAGTAIASAASTGSSATAVSVSLSVSAGKDKHPSRQEEPSRSLSAASARAIEVPSRSNTTIPTETMTLNSRSNDNDTVINSSGGGSSSSISDGGSSSISGNSSSSSSSSSGSISGGGGGSSSSSSSNGKGEAQQSTSRLRQRFHSIKDSSSRIDLDYSSPSSTAAPNRSEQVSESEFKSSFLEKFKETESETDKEKDKKGRKPPVSRNESNTGQGSGSIPRHEKANEVLLDHRQPPSSSSSSGGSSGSSSSIRTAPVLRDEGSNDSRTAVGAVTNKVNLPQQMTASKSGNVKSVSDTGQRYSPGHYSGSSSDDDDDDDEDEEEDDDDYDSYRAAAAVAAAPPPNKIRNIQMKIDSIIGKPTAAAPSKPLLESPSLPSDTPSPPPLSGPGQQQQLHSQQHDRPRLSHISEPFHLHPRQVDGNDADEDIPDGNDQDYYDQGDGECEVSAQVRILRSNAKDLIASGKQAMQLLLIPHTG